MEEIRRLHEAMGIQYPLPDLDSPLFAVKGLYRPHGELLGACAVKLIGESFLWIDPQASTRKKIETIQHLSRAAIQTAKRIGLDETSAWIPPHIEPTFAHMLTNLGWIKSPWPSWSKIL